MVSSAVAVPKVIDPDPDTLDQRYEAIPLPASEAVASCVKLALLVWSDPALTVGAVVSNTQPLFPETLVELLPGFHVAPPVAAESCKER